MSGSTFDKKTALRMERRSHSADSLGHAVKERLRDCVLVKEADGVTLFVPEAKSGPVLIALRGQFGTALEGRSEYIWNNETGTGEQWQQVELPTFAVAPLDDAIKRKKIPHTTWRVLEKNEKPLDALTQVVEARATQALH